MRQASVRLSLFFEGDVRFLRTPMSWLKVRPPITERQAGYNTGRACRGTRHTHDTRMESGQGSMFTLYRSFHAKPHTVHPEKPAEDQGAEKPAGDQGSEKPAGDQGTEKPAEDQGTEKPAGVPTGARGQSQVRVCFGREEW